MHKDPLSAFLQTDAWLSHTHGSRDQVGNIFVRQALPGKGSYWIASRCAIPQNWTVPDFAKKAWFLRLQPDSQESYDTILATTKAYKHRKAFAIQPTQTSVLDLTQSEDSLLAGMKQKHRYNIKVAEKHGVQIELHHENLMTVFPRFWNLLHATAERQTFRTHTKSHYESVVKNLEKCGGVYLGFATYEGKDIATVMIIKEGTTGIYLHGGSDYEYRNLMAPYLLHWQVIQTLKQAGVTTYDLWGVHVNEKGEEITGHPSSGTTRFKLGFGGSIVTYPPTLDIILNPICYTLYTGIQRLRSQKRAFS